MRIVWTDWRISSYEYGYKLQKRLNSRWITKSYHGEMEKAVLELFHYRIRTETADMVINAVDESSARLGTAKLVKKIEAIANEILKGLN